jgi:hypothetical protein
VDRPCEELADRRLLDDAPGVHHRGLVGDLGGHSEVVGHEHDGQAQATLEIAKQPHDLCLHRDVERGRRLVGQQELGLARERDGDHRALPHPARDLVRVASQHALGRRYLDQIDQLAGAPARVGGASPR